MNSDFNDILSKLSHLRVCRLCLGVEDLKHSLYENNGRLIKKLDGILPIQLSENECFPEKICKKCYENIEIVENFYSTVYNAENQLLNYITNKNHEENFSVENADILETYDLYENNNLSDCNEEEIEIKESDILDDKPFALESLENNNGIEQQNNEKEKEKHNQKDLEEHYKNHYSDDDNIPLSMYKQNKAKTDFEAQSTVDVSKKEYICETCNKKFSSRKGITQHSKLHSNGGFVCEICNYNTKRLDHMNEHKKLHMPPFEYWCEYCKTGFNVKSWLYRHMKQHPQYLKCEQCDITFTKRERLINHNFNQHPSDDLHEKLKCDLCPYSANIKSLLHQHMKLHMPPFEYWCEYCKTGFNVKSWLYRHMKQHPQYLKCEQCDITFTKRERLINHNFNQHPSDDLHEKLKCDLCPYSANIKSLLQQHMKLHMPPFEYWCEYCKTGFNVKSWLYRHMKQHPQYLKCEQCDITFTNRANFLSHNFTQHPSNDHRKKFKCDLCPYSANIKPMLYRHIKLHMPPYKYFCKFCNEGYNLRSWLLKHESTHPEHLTCQICESSFKTKLKLLSHMHNNHKVKETPYRYKCKPCSLKWKASIQLYRHNVHVHGHPPDYMCDVCGRKFINIKGFRIHQDMHAGIKPFICGYCEKAFVSKPLLIEHIRVHTGEKPYKCNECTKAFTQKSSLTIHKRVHTRERPFECVKCHKTFIARGLLTTHEKKCLYWDKSQIQTKKHKDLEIK